MKFESIFNTKYDSRRVTMIITRQETFDNIRNKIDEKSLSLHFFFNFIFQNTKQLQKMQHDN
jgi:hypothetical protein